MKTPWDLNLEPYFLADFLFIYVCFVVLIQSSSNVNTLVYFIKHGKHTLDFFFCQQNFFILPFVCFLHPSL